MAPKTEDRKAAAASAKAAEEEEGKWQQGAKTKSNADARKEKDAEKARKKAELARLTEEDDKATPGKKVNAGGKGSAKGSAKGGAKGGDAAGGDNLDDLDLQIASFSATNLDDALEAMNLVSEKDNKASRGAAAGAMEKHPERRFKAAFEAYKEQELPKLREDRPGLRLQQYNDLLYKHFQLHVSYDASKEDKLAVLKAKRDATATRLAG
ncbi:hypothetical protein MVES_002268 [Malassezia vespertilionis]|uniref:DUF1014-domain-containing protein n=1 Tax=Malassezia vespertilionis TaxID=2020962 RepID=A0A2N1JBL3_9BASI|nr:hypothetical protein MVES_002268 [Malassezia vespertilionis]